MQSNEFPVLVRRPVVRFVSAERPVWAQVPQVAAVAPVARVAPVSTERLTGEAYWANNESKQCRCGRRKRVGSQECVKCTREWMVRRALEDDQLAADINRAISGGLVLIAKKGTIPAGKRIKSVYVGVPGLWYVDQDGHHWCGLDETWAAAAKWWNDGNGRACVGSCGVFRCSNDICHELTCEEASNWCFGKCERGGF